MLFFYLYIKLYIIIVATTIFNYKKPFQLRFSFIVFLYILTVTS